MEPRESERWHLSRSVSISHLLTTGALIFGALMYVTDIRQDIAVHTEQIITLNDKIENINDTHNEAFNKIDSKLDKLFDLMYTIASQGRGNNG